MTTPTQCSKCQGTEGSSFFLYCEACEAHWCRSCLGGMKETACMVREYRCLECDGKVVVNIPLGEMITANIAARAKRKETRDKRQKSKAYQSIGARRRKK